MNRMQRLKRVCAMDIETCHECGGTLRVIARFEDPPLIRKILAHVHRRDALIGGGLAARGPPPDSWMLPNVTQTGWVANSGVRILRSHDVEIHVEPFQQAQKLNELGRIPGDLHQTRGHCIS
jgi:hypothetical protein